MNGNLTHPQPRKFPAVITSWGYSLANQYGIIGKLTASFTAADLMNQMRASGMGMEIACNPADLSAVKELLRDTTGSGKPLNVRIVTR